MTSEEALDRDIEACIEFFTLDIRRINKAIRTHREGQSGLCTSHQEEWPCFTRRLAEQARTRVLQLPIPREATP